MRLHEGLPHLEPLVSDITESISQFSENHSIMCWSFWFCSECLTFEVSFTQEKNPLTSGNRSNQHSFPGHMTLQ